VLRDQEHRGTQDHPVQALPSHSCSPPGLSAQAGESAQSLLLSAVFKLEKNVLQKGTR
jgi:hypothetical protein